MKQLDVVSLKIEKEKLKNLPVFYQFVLYNEIINNSIEKKYVYKIERFDSVSAYHPAKKLISKIVDYALIKENIVW